MIILHHLEHSRSLRILWALEELGLEYEVKFYKRLPTYAAPPELKNIHPLGKAPVLTDGDLVIANPKDLMQYNYWMHYAEGSLMPYLVMTLVMNNVPKHVPFLIKPIANKICDGVKGGFINPRLKEHSAYLENYLSQHEYFAGDFSFADIQMSFPVVAMQERVKAHNPQMVAYVQRIQQRPAFKKAKELSGF